MGGWEMKDSMVHDGLWCAFNDYHMGITAENIADKYGPTRDEQDAFAAQSQQRAEAALGQGLFAEEICAVSVLSGGEEPGLFEAIQFPASATAEKLGKSDPPSKGRHRHGG